LKRKEVKEAEGKRKREKIYADGGERMTGRQSEERGDVVGRYG
jgi:hypothetical protein